MGGSVCLFVDWVLTFCHCKSCFMTLPLTMVKWETFVYWVLTFCHALKFLCARNTRSFWAMPMGQVLSMEFLLFLLPWPIGIVFCLFPKWPIQVSFYPMANWSILSFVLNGQLKVSIFLPRPIGRMFHQLSSQVVNWECQLSFIQQLSSKMFTSVIHCHLDCWECHLSLIEQLSSKMFTSVIHCHLDGLECHLLSWEYQLNDCHPLFIQVVVGSVNCIYHLWMEFFFFQIDVVECWRWIKLC